MGGSLAKAFLRGASRRDGPNTVLTRREVEVLQMLANGASSGDVAKKLFISGKTVKNHLAHIYSKLGRDEPDPSRGQGRKVRDRPYWLSRS